MIFVGIDPGKEGAVAWMDSERKAVNVRDCPLVRGEYDYQGMADLLFEFAGPDTAVTIEAVHSMPSDARRAAFTFGKGYGAWLALIGGIMRTAPTLVDPKTWKKAMLSGVANNKAMEAEVLKQRFAKVLDPSSLLGPLGGLKDGRVDALWLAEYGRTHWRPQQRKAA